MNVTIYLGYLRVDFAQVEMENITNVFWSKNMFVVAGFHGLRMNDTICSLHFFEIIDLNLRKCCFCINELKKSQRARVISIFVRV